MTNILELRKSLRGEKPVPQEEDFSELEEDINKLRKEGFSLQDIQEAIDDMNEVVDKKKAKGIAKKSFNYAEIYILRHGSMHLNSEDKVRGWLDVPLDEKGIREAHDLGKEIIAYDLDGLVSSDMTRTVQTAGAVCQEAGVPIFWVTSAFRPWNVGECSGKSGEEVAPIMEEYARHKPDEPMKDGESFNEFKNRFLSGVEEVKKKFEGQKIGIITHHRGDRIFAAWEKLGMPKDYSVDLDTLFEEGVQPGESRKEGEKINMPKDHDLS